MKPETAAKIARRIGMIRMVNDFEELWADPVSRPPLMAASDLPTYLATGDRPLRVMESIADGSFVLTRTGRWEVSRVVPGGTRWGVGDTPAAAILACAAALEEGQ